MKKIVIFLVGFLTAVVSVAQTEMDEIKVTAPVFKGEFYESITALLNSGVEYPSEAKNAGFQGTAVIDFTVNMDGRLSDFKIINSIAPEIDQEIIRVLQTTEGKWIPGTANGEAVNMEKEVAVAFKLHSNVDFVAKAKRYLHKANEMMFAKNNPAKALKYYDRGITFLPYEEVLLAMRGLCNYELGNEEEARMDWERIVDISTTSQIKEYALETKVLEGIEKFAQVMKN